MIEVSISKITWFYKSLKFHLQNAKNHGVTQEEIVEILTHAAFYAAYG